MEAQFRDVFADVEGVLIHWVEIGEDGNRPPVILLHGIGDSHVTWRHIAPDLARDRRVIMPDLPGHGYSSRGDSSYALGWNAKVLAAWIRPLNLPSFDLVGHSYGGGVAQMLLLECPNLIRRLVLVASGGLGHEVGFALRLAALPYVVEMLGQPFMGQGTRLALRSLSARDKGDLAESVRINRRRGTARSFARTVRDIIDWRGQSRYFAERAHEIVDPPPIAVFWGDHDPLIPLSHGKSFARDVEGVVLETFPGAGHFIHQDQPEAFVARLRAYLDAPSQPRTRMRPPRAPGTDQGQRGALRRPVTGESASGRC
jgi:pimeloyl-ACP methyl ester carboxylesterase